ncbi:MAG: dihydroorotase-like [Parcubacteria group bacterium Gr01-1014_56]|nr:MAG: dihydroorotase-like [Parcubacteria group bacterium Gr01-1014_56]
MTRVPALENPHTHWREGDVVGPLVELAIQGGAIGFGPMPNTKEGLMTAAQVTAYVKNASSFVELGTGVHIIPIVQITEATTEADIDACIEAGIVDAKIYPKGRTTASHNGVSYYSRILPIVQHAGKRGMRVHFHPEHPMKIDNKDAEFLFLPIVDMFLSETDAIIVSEHGTDGRCIPLWEEWAKTGRFFVTITAHHLVENETGAYGDVDAVCKPSYKGEVDRRALNDLVRKDYPWVMAGGDDAPHDKKTKHRIGPCTCGAYTAPFLMQLYAHALDDLFTSPEGVKVFENFTSRNARKLYGFRTSSRYVDLIKRPFIIPESYKIGSWEVAPFWAGREISYSLYANSSVK